MNRSLPPGDCGHRGSDPVRASRRARAVPGAYRLVGGAEDSLRKRLNMNQSTESDHLAAVRNWIARMMVESNETEFCRILLQRIDEDKITVRLDADKPPAFMARQVEPDVEELTSLIDESVYEAILYLFLQKKLAFRTTVVKGKRNLEWSLLKTDSSVN